MSSFRGQADRPDRAKAIAAVAAVHLALAAVILSGLNVRTVEQVADRLSTFNVRQRPPPPPPPPPKPKPQRAKLAEGAPARRAQPSPIVAPKPVIPRPSEIAAAKIAGAGSASSSGAGTSGTGTGAGGRVDGPGGGGADFSRFSPARIVRNLSNRDYHRLAAGRMPTGGAIVSLRVEPSGLASNCRIVRSSGDPFVDGGLCPLITQRLRFRPALDDQGRPIAYGLQSVATWRL